MPIPDTQMKLIDIDKIPGALRKRRQEWAEYLQKIPVGKAWVLDEKEAKTTAGNVKAMVKRIMEDGTVVHNYKVIQRTVAGKPTIYILNEGRQSKVSGGNRENSEI